MNYEAKDFMETADQDTLNMIARARKLTRDYYFSDYNDIQKRREIAWSALLPRTVCASLRWC